MKIYEAKEWYGKIVEYESEKQTEKFVFINGSRYARVNNYSAFFNTKEEAKQHLINFCNERISDLNNKLDDYNYRIKKIKEL